MNHARPVVQRLAVFSGVALLMAMASACGSDSGSSPSPTPTVINIAGVWSGTALDNILPGASPTTLNIQQSGTSVTGSFTVKAGGGATGQGTVQGTINGSSFSVTLTILAGGYPTDPKCVQTVTGTLQVQGSSMTGPYTSTFGAGCSPPSLTTTGTTTLTKQ